MPYALSSFFVLPISKSESSGVEHFLLAILHVSSQLMS